MDPDVCPKQHSTLAGRVCRHPNTAVTVSAETGLCFRPLLLTRSTGLSLPFTPPPPAGCSLLDVDLPDSAFAPFRPRGLSYPVDLALVTS